MFDFTYTRSYNVTGIGNQKVFPFLAKEIGCRVITNFAKDEGDTKRIAISGDYDQVNEFKAKVREIDPDGLYYVEL